MVLRLANRGTPSVTRGSASDKPGALFLKLQGRIVSTQDQLVSVNDDILAHSPTFRARVKSGCIVHSERGNHSA